MPDPRPEFPGPPPDSATCWRTVQRAADGDSGARASFGQAYLPLIRAILAARWSGGAHAAEVDDAVQDVFVGCFRAGGPLTRAIWLEVGGLIVECRQRRCGA